MTPRKIILDLDPGADAALALCIALADPGLEVVAATATGGAARPDQSTRNLQALVERVDPPLWPRIGAADTQQFLRTDGRRLHGANGLGGVRLPHADTVQRHGAVHLMADLVRKDPNDLTIVGAGPMSNLAALLRLEPDMPSLVGQLILAGGSVAVGGDATAAAEFNVYCDAIAARDVLRARVTKTLVPLDVSRELTFGYDLIEFVKDRSSRTAQLMAEVLPEYYLALRQQQGVEDAALGDLAPVLLAACPDLFETESMHVDVETTGELTHGVTVCDRRQGAVESHNAEVVVSIDLEGARDAVYTALDRAV